jgi:hypothetical protein
MGVDGNLWKDNQQVAVRDGGRHEMAPKCHQVIPVRLFDQLVQRLGAASALVREFAQH